MSHNFKVGNYCYYFDGKDNYPVKILQIKKRIQVTDSVFFIGWVSPNSLTLQDDTL